MTTNYDKWNRLKPEDLGWTEADEVNERMTPAMRELLMAQENDKRLRDAKQSLEAARAEHARLRVLNDELTAQRTSLDKKMNIMSIVFVVGVIILMFVFRESLQPRKFEVPLDNTKAAFEKVAANEP